MQCTTPVFLHLLLGLVLIPTAPSLAQDVRHFDVPRGDHPHAVAPAPDGTVWYTGKSKGALGRLNPQTGEVERIPLGEGSRPHGVILGPDGAAWVTDSGLNAILRVDPESKGVKSWPLPENRANADLNSAAFDRHGRIWFTGQAGIVGRLDPESGKMDVWDAPKKRGPYGMAATRGGDIYYASLNGSYLGKPDLETGETNVIMPENPHAGLRRVWPDSKGRLWVSEWNTGYLGVYDPAAGTWKKFKLPGREPHTQAVYVDDNDKVWVSDFGGNVILRFDPQTEHFKSFPSEKPDAAVPQLAGRPGEVWGAESGTDRLVLIQTEGKEARN